MKILDGFTNWVRDRMSPARTTSQMLADMESEDLIGTERRRGQAAAVPLPGGNPSARPSDATPRDDRRQ